MTHLSLLNGRSHDIAVDDLDQADAAIIADYVKGLGLDIGAVHNLPGHVIFGELGIGRVGGLLGYGLDSLRAIVMVRDAHAVGNWLVQRRDDGDWIRTCVCLTQLNMFCVSQSISLDLFMGIV